MMETVTPLIRRGGVDTVYVMVGSPQSRPCAFCKLVSVLTAVLDMV